MVVWVKKACCVRASRVFIAGTLGFGYERVSGFNDDNDGNDGEEI
jgi:hypothetical protein